MRLRRVTALFVTTTVALLGAVVPAIALITRGSAGAPITVSFKDPNGTTSTTLAIAADGTYKTDFGISVIGDYTATVKKSDGTTLATVPIAVTQTAKPCLTPTAGTGTDWGVTHSPFPLDPRFPSYVTICGRVALASTGNSSTPAGSPPSLGTPGSVTRDRPSESAGAAADGDDGSDFPWLWIIVVIVIIGVGVVAVLVWQRGRADTVGSMYPDYSDSVGPTEVEDADVGGMYPEWYRYSPPTDAPDSPPSSTPDVM